MKTAIVIRPLQPQNLRRILALEAEAFVEDAWDAELFAFYALVSPDLFLVARVNSKIAGYCIGRIRTRHDAEIDSIAVFQRYQRRGIALALVRNLLRRFRRRGITAVTLMVRPDNAPAIALYRRLGFIHRRTVARYYADGSRGWRMSLRQR